MRSALFIVFLTILPRPSQWTGKLMALPFLFKWQWCIRTAEMDLSGMRRRRYSNPVVDLILPAQ